jgi:hypothetical protein
VERGLDLAMELDAEEGTARARAIARRQTPVARSEQGRPRELQVTQI